MQSVAFEAAWDYWRPYPRGGKTMFTLSPVVGVQWYGTSFDIENDSSALPVNHDNSWLAVYGGLRFDLGWDTRQQIGWIDSLSIGTEFTAGALLGNDGGSLWGLQAGLALEFSKGLSGYFGYRLREMNGEDGEVNFMNRNFLASNYPYQGCFNIIIGTSTQIFNSMRSCMSGSSGNGQDWKRLGGVIDVAHGKGLAILYKSWFKIAYPFKINKFDFFI
jgi:hypothetical protein